MGWGGGWGSFSSISSLCSFGDLGSDCGATCPKPRTTKVDVLPCCLETVGERSRLKERPSVRPSRPACLPARPPRLQKQTRTPALPSEPRWQVQERGFDGTSPLPKTDGASSRGSVGVVRVSPVRKAGAWSRCGRFTSAENQRETCSRSRQPLRYSALKVALKVNVYGIYVTFVTLRYIPDKCGFVWRKPSQNKCITK